MTKKTAFRGVYMLVLMLSISLLSFSQNNFPVAGTIADENGQPLSGVTLQVKGTNTSATTTGAGYFELNAPSGNSTLIISYVGYETREFDLQSRHKISVSMKLGNGSLGDVVVIGYGSQKRKNVTGAVATLKNDNFDQRPIARVDQALVGQLAGVTVKQTTGVPGKAFSIQVRGTGSITGGNEPLYVIDGFPLTVNASNTTNGSYTTGNPLDNINPSDIETIEVLKDAAAAAIYGSRASNGVVLITTKRGQLGKPKINLNAYTGFNQASKKLQMLNGQQWIDRATEIINAAYVLKYGSAGASATDDAATRRLKIGLSPTQINTSYMLDPRWATPGHPGLEFEDWQNAIEQKGLVQNYEVSASGGTDAVRYFISGNYVNQDGFIKKLNYTAYSARANVDINLSKKIKVGLYIAPTYSITQDPGVEGKDNLFHQALTMTPVQEDSVGYYPNIGKNAQYPWSNSLNAPLGKLVYNKGTTKRFRTLSTIYGEYQIIKGLSLRTQVNYDHVDNIINSYFPYTAAGSQATRTFTGANNVLAGTSGAYASYRRQTFVNENTLTYNTTIHKDHSLNILIGQSYNVDRLDRLSINSSGGYTSSVIQTLNAAAAIVFNSGAGTTGSTRSVLESYFSRLQYSFKDKYLLSASLRSDGSSRFGVNHQYGIFPSASVGWRIIQENFMSKLSAISDLKLRLSYGVNGNNNLPSDYASIATLGSAGYVFGAPGAVIGQSPNSLANPELRWEKSQTYDLGLDFGLFNNRITGSFDYYNKLSTDLLLNVQVPEATGFQSYITNIGSVRNIGEELEITSRNLTGKLQWTTSINISHNTNKIVALAPGQKQIIIPNGLVVTDQILRVGSPLNSIYVVRQNGFLTQDDITKKVPVYGTGETVGDPRYVDFNNDGVITEADKQIVGHPNPDYTYGMTNTVRYKGFDLSVLVQGQSGGSIYSMLGRAISRTGQGFTDNAPESYTKRWMSPDNPGAGRFSKAYSTFGFVANTDWLYSSDYIRVRDITLGYDLKSLFKTNALQGARIYLTLENFFGHDKYYNGLNPEAVNTPISSNTSYPEAEDYGGLPLAKSFIVGLNFTF